MSRLSQGATEPAYYIVDCRIFEEQPQHAVGLILEDFFFKIISEPMTLLWMIFHFPVLVGNLHKNSVKIDMEA